MQVYIRLLFLRTVTFLCQLNTGKHFQFPSMFFKWSFCGFSVVNPKIPYMEKVPIFHAWIMYKFIDGFKVFQSWKFLTDHVTVVRGNLDIQDWKQDFHD